MQKDGRACYLEAINGLCGSLKERLSALDGPSMEEVRELRLLAGMPPVVNVAGRTRALPGAPIDRRELEQSVLGLCGRSMHTHQRELAEGYLSLKGGHRAGVAATAVYGADKTLQCVREVTAIVIRVAHDHEGMALPLLERLFPNGLCGLILAGAPGSGKTTLLRDLARVLGRGALPGCHAAVLVDERGELGRGVDGCCVLRGYDKGDGILSAVRSLSPQVVLCDEIGSRKDVEAVRWALNCGVAVVTSIHARSAAELLSREAGRALLRTGAFERAALLSDRPRPCTVKEVISGDELVALNWHCDADIELLGRRPADGRTAAASSL